MTIKWHGKTHLAKYFCAWQRETFLWHLWHLLLTNFETQSKISKNVTWQTESETWQPLQLLEIFLDISPKHIPGSLLKVVQKDRLFIVFYFRVANFCQDLLGGHHSCHGWTSSIPLHQVLKSFTTIWISIWLDPQTPAQWSNSQLQQFQPAWLPPPRTLASPSFQKLSYATSTS